jgi:probable rRNA maturation factor
LLPPELAAEMDRHLGDVVIAYPYAERQAQRFGNSLAAELRLLAIHGTLHLLGYDHATSDEEEAMWAEQEAILAPLGEANLARRTYGE